MFFTGETRSRKVGLRGSSKSEASRDEVLARSRREREQRQRLRAATNAATVIQAHWRRRLAQSATAEQQRELWSGIWDAAAGFDSRTLLEPLLADSRCLASLLHFFDPNRGDDWRRLGAVCSALVDNGGEGLVAYIRQHHQQQQEGQQQHQQQQQEGRQQQQQGEQEQQGTQQGHQGQHTAAVGPPLPSWVLCLQRLALRCLAALVHSRGRLQRVLQAPRGACSASNPEEHAAAATAECLLALISPDPWQRACGQPTAGLLLAGMLDFLARRGPLLRLLAHLASALPVRAAAAAAAPPLGEALVTQAAVRFMAQQQQQQQQGQQGQQQQQVFLTDLACTPGLWQRCPSLVPAGPQLMLRALQEPGALPGANQLAACLPCEQHAGKGAAAAAWLGNLVFLGDRVVVPAMLAIADQQVPASAQLTAVLLALLELVPEAALPQAAAGSASAAAGEEERSAVQRASSPWLPMAVAAPESGRLPLSPPSALDTLVVAQLTELGGDAGIALLRRLVTVEMPFTDVSGSHSPTRVAASRAWHACRLAWTVLSALPHMQRLRGLLALSVAAQLPARVWFNVLRPLQRAAQAGIAAGAMLLPEEGPGHAWGGVRTLWHDPGWLLPLLVLSQTLGSFLATADASDLHSALPLCEVHDAAAPQVGLLPMLRQTLWQVIVAEGDQTVPSPKAATLRGAFASSAGALLVQLAEWNHRLEFAPAAAFVADAFSSERFHAEAAATGVALGPDGGRQRLAQLLRFSPCLVPFEDRVQLLHREIHAERQAAAEAEASAAMLSGDPWGAVIGWGGERRFVPIRRDRLLLDGFEQLDALGPERLRGRVRIQYIDEHGGTEAGIDGGGLFKDFMDEVLRQGFDPQYGLFAATPQRELYPSPAGYASLPNAPALLGFLGRMLGKAVYEGVLLELPLAGFFLKKFSGKRCDLGDLASLDPEVHRHLLALRHFKGGFAELALSFTISEELPGGGVREVELKPGGALLPVDPSNVVEYVHRVADFRLNHQMAGASGAFLRGFFDVVRPGWVSVFSEWELQAVISGRDPGGAGLDLADMRAHTGYAGGYHDEGHPVIDALWRVLSGFTPQQQRAFLKFTTGCSRPPLLGFAALEPRLCIAMAGTVLDDSATERLPTSSACINTLKLPPYADVRRMREKLLYAITARSGFDLS